MEKSSRKVRGPQPLEVVEDGLLGLLVVGLPDVLRRQAGLHLDVIEVSLRLDRRDVALLLEAEADVIQHRPHVGGGRIRRRRNRAAAQTWAGRPALRRPGPPDRRRGDDGRRPPGPEQRRDLRSRRRPQAPRLRTAPWQSKVHESTVHGPSSRIRGHWSLDFGLWAYLSAWKTSGRARRWGRPFLFKRGRPLRRARPDGGLPRPPRLHGRPTDRLPGRPRCPRPGDARE